MADQKRIDMSERYAARDWESVRHERRDRERERNQSRKRARAVKHYVQGR